MAALSSTTSTTTSTLYIAPPLTEEREKALNALKTRSKYKYEKLNSSAYVPSPLLLTGAETLKSLADKGMLAGSVEPLIVAKQITPGLLVQLESDIKNHAEERIFRFLLQALLAYKIGVIFFEGKTQIQVGDWTLEQGRNPDNLADSPYAAAHSSTLPCLWCQQPGSSQKYEFGKDTFIDASFNTTVLLPKAINNPFDTSLDEGVAKIGMAESLRAASLKILNIVSNGNWTPLQGLEHFINLVLPRLVAIEGRYPGEVEQHAVKQYRFVFEAYKKIILDSTFIRKFTLVKTKDAGEVDEPFYLFVRDQMYQKMQAAQGLISALKGKARLSPVKITTLSSGEEQILLDGKAGKDTLLCCRSEAIRKAVKEYLMTRPLDARQSDIEAIKALDNARKKGQAQFPAAVQGIYTLCLETIQKEEGLKKLAKAAEASTYYPKDMEKIVRVVLGLLKGTSARLKGTGQKYLNACLSSDELAHCIETYKNQPDKENIKLQVQTKCLKIIRDMYAQAKARQAAPKKPASPKHFPQIIRKVIQDIDKEQQGQTLTDQPRQLRAAKQLTYPH